MQNVVMSLYRTAGCPIKVVDDYVEAENQIPTVFINYRDKLDPNEDA